MRKIIFVDVETGGLDPTTHALLEIGAVSACGRHEFSLRVAAGSFQVDDEALAVNGIPREQVDWGATRKMAAVAFAKWLREEVGAKRGWVLAGMNPQFDAGFIRELAFDYPFETRVEEFPMMGHRVWDVHSVAVQDVMMRDGWAGEVMPLHSDAIAEMCGIAPEPKPHRALAGAKHARAVMMALCCADEDAEEVASGEKCFSGAATDDRRYEGGLAV